jgi:hypothetical protein
MKIIRVNGCFDCPLYFNGADGKYREGCNAADIEVPTFYECEENPNLKPNNCPLSINGIWIKLMVKT